MKIECKRIAGIDEVGRGCLAGPVVVAGVILPPEFYHSLIKDSKATAKKNRKIAEKIIKENALSWCIVEVSESIIDQINIREAVKLGMEQAVLKLSPDLALIDGNMRINCAIQQETIVCGDALKIEISAASIIAKVYRDELMEKMDTVYPGYGFKNHVGYPTKEHKSAIKTLGITRIHRKTFKGVLEHVDCRQAWRDDSTKSAREIRIFSS